MRSSIYNKYLKLKEENNDNFYLFKVGMFYIFIADDAIRISKITTLKLINHTKDIVKCGFPEKGLDKYLDIFNNIGINVVIVNNEQCNEIDKYLNMIRELDINNITPIESLKILSDFKELL